jgi:hypothetical protein
MAGTQKTSKQDQKLRGLRNNPSSEWRFAYRFYNNEILPLIEYIKNNWSVQVESDYQIYRYRITFEKYLIVSCVSVIEYFIKRKMRKSVDTQNIDISYFNLSKKYEKRKLGHPNITVGEFIAVNYDFTNLYTINTIATDVLNYDLKFKALNIEFLDAVKKIDWFDPYKYVKKLRVRAIYHSRNFELMFKMRNEIVHEMRYRKIELPKLGAFCDNTMNFLDAADFIFDISSRNDVIARLKSNKTMRQLHYNIPVEYR